MTNIINRRIVKVGEDAVHTLSEILNKDVSAANRAAAERNVDNLLRVLAAYADMIQHVQQINSKVYFAGKFIETTLNEIETITPAADAPATSPSATRKRARAG